MRGISPEMLKQLKVITHREPGLFWLDADPYTKHQVKRHCHWC